MTAPTFDLDEAAAFLKLHPKTLQARAKAGTIPGAKLGRRWVFLAADLEKFIREQYACLSTESGGSGTSTSNTTERELANLLGLPTRKPRRSTTTGDARNSGATSNSVIPFRERSATP